MTATRVVIIGGGVSGLALAHRLVERRQRDAQPLDITLLEAGPRLGGTIRTDICDGFLLERGPDAFLAEKPWAVALCRRLGLGDQLIDTQPEARRSFLVRGNRLHAVPQGWFLIAPERLSLLPRTPFLSWPGKLRMACEPWVPPRRGDADESVGAFIRRRFGREALTWVGQPMIGGIYAADPERLSLQAAMPKLAGMEREHGSVIRALRSRAWDQAAGARAASGPRYHLFVTLRDGMESLVTTLAASLAGVRVRTGAPVLRVQRGAAWRVTLADGAALDADQLCVALPGQAASRVLRDALPELAAQLAEIPYASAATVNLGFRSDEMPRQVRGAGCVVPLAEGRAIIGCTFAHQKFAGRAPQGHVLLRAFLGGPGSRGALDADDHELLRLVREDLRALFGITAEPRVQRISRYREAMPQYQVGHLDRVAAIERVLQAAPGLTVTGNSLHGVGIPDCIREAETAAELVLARAGHALEGVTA